MQNKINKDVFGSPYSEKPKLEKPSTRAERQEFFLPVTGFVWLYPEEMAVINHPAFQRLGKINQLGQAHLVFRGATHKRIEHVLGAVHVVQRMIAAVTHNQSKLVASGAKSPGAPTNNESRFIRLAALMHDIGHVAAGHTLEDELGIIGQHDADQRLDLIFGMKGSEFGGISDEVLEEVINRNYWKYVPEKLANSGLTPSIVLRLLIRKTPKPPAIDRFQREAAMLAESSDIRLHVCTNMVGNTICADLLDYIYRDWYHVGKPRTFEDRILQYMEIRRTDSTGKRQAAPDAEDSRSPQDKFVIALGASPKIRTDGVSAILGLLEWRYELAETVLFHRVKVTAAAMLDRALYELWEHAEEGTVIGEVLQLSDEQLLDHCIDLTADELSKGELSDARIRSLKITETNLRKLKNRVLYKELRTWTIDQLGPEQLKSLKGTYAGSEGVSRQSAQNRSQLVRELELDFDLTPGSLAVYCSQAKAKIAEVAIAVGDTVAPFHQYEKDNRDRLSGGHLLAQIERFERLWRLQVFVDSEQQRRLSEQGLLDTLKSAVEAAILVDGSGSAVADRMRQLALRLGQEISLPYRGKKVAASPFPGGPKYPSGAPCVRSFFE